MTRINCIPVSELTDKHLLAEFRELPRISSYIRKSLNKHNNDIRQVEREIPESYTMGKGHVKFFYNKLFYLYNRYINLFNECSKRGFNVEMRPWLTFLLNESTFPSYWADNWYPDKDAIEINRERIKIRLEEAKKRREKKHEVRSIQNKSQK